eukprot:gene10557-7329_t
MPAPYNNRATAASKAPAGLVAPILDSNEKERKVGEMKNCLSVAEICEGCPTSFHAALRHARDLKFSQAPSYDTLREWLLQDLVEAGETCDYIFDWDTDAKRTNSPQATGTGLESGSGATERLPTLRAAQDHPATPPRPPTLPTASTPADDANRTCGTTRVWSMQTAEGMGNSTSRGATVPKLQTTACASSREMITPSSTPQSHGITSLVSGPQSGRNMEEVRHARPKESNTSELPTHWKILLSFELIMCLFARIFILVLQYYHYYYHYSFLVYYYFVLFVSLFLIAPGSDLYEGEAAGDRTKRIQGTDEA